MAIANERRGGEPLDSTERSPVFQSGGPFDGGPPLAIQKLVRLIKPGEPRIVRRAVLAVLIGWLPLGILAGIQGPVVGHGGAGLFVSDIAVHARSLIAVPLLIFAESICIPELGSIARHFLDAGFVTAQDRGRFNHAIVSTRRLLNSTWAEIIILLLAYTAVAALLRYVPHDQIPAWQTTVDDGDRPRSLAGWWHVLVSIPLLMIIFFGWLWRVFLWARFLWLMSRLDLQLIPAHPDLAAGLKFVAGSLRAFSPLGLAFGVIVAGGVTNRVLHEGTSPFAYRNYVIVLVLFVLVLFVVPLLVFAWKLLDAKRRGIAEYGALAGRVGTQFEQKWLNREEGVNKGVLDVPDFSTTTDLYSVVSKVYDMSILPVELRKMGLLVAATLLPFLPVALMAVPFNVLLKELAKLLF